MITTKDVFSPDLLNGIDKINQSFDNISLAVSKMATEIKKSAETSGKAYRENQVAINQLVKINETQIKLSKEKNTLTKEQNKILADAKKQVDKQTDADKQLLATEKKLYQSQKDLTKAKKEGINIENSYVKLIENQKQKLKDVAKAHGKLGDEYATEVANLKKIKTEQSKFLKDLKEQNKLVGVADDSIAKMSKELATLKAQYRNASAEARKGMLPTIQALDTKVKSLDAGIGNYQRNVGNYGSAFSKLGGTFTKVAGVAGGLGLAMGGLEIATNVKDKVIELNKEATIIGATFEITGKELDRFTAKLNSLATAYNSDSETIISSTNALAKEFGIEAVDSLELVQMALERGLDLENIREYSAQFKSAGLNAEEMISILDTSQKEGIFSDKGADAIKEGLLRLREMTPATREALLAIGMTSEEINQGIADGTLASFEGMQKVSEKLNSFEDSSPVVGQALADIFGGAGEDAGIRYIKMLQDVDMNLENSTTTVTTMQQANQKLSESFNNLILQFSIGTEGGMNDAMIMFVDFIAQIVNLTAETNFLGRAYGQIIEPIFEMFSSLGNLLNVFGSIKGATEETSGSLDALSGVFDFLIFTTKLATTGIRLVMNALTFLFKVGAKIGKELSEPLSGLFEIFNKIKLIIEPIKEAITKLIGDAFEKLNYTVKTIVKEGLTPFNFILDAVVGSLGDVIDFIGKFVDNLDFLKNETIKSSGDINSLLGTMSAEQMALQTRVTLNQIEENSRLNESNQRTTEEIAKQNEKRKQDYENYLKERDRLRTEYGLKTAEEFYQEDQKKLDDALKKKYITEQEHYDLSLQLQDDYQKKLAENSRNATVGGDEEIETQTPDLFENQVANDLLNVRDLLNQSPEEAFSWLKFLGLDDEKSMEDFKQALNEVVNVAVKAGEDILNQNIETTEKEIDLRDENIDSLNDELQKEIEIQQSKEASGVAYDTTKIENLQNSIENEKKLKEQQQEDLAKQERRLVLYQLGIDQASAISSLIAMSNGNPLNLLTGGAAGIAQLLAGLVTIGANFKLAYGKLKQYGEGGAIDYGNSHANGGTIIEAEKGEFVIKKDIVSKYQNEISLLNAGVPLENLTNSQPSESQDFNLDMERNMLLSRIANKKAVKDRKKYVTLKKK